MDFLAQILGLIAKNKKFPAYQAERRIDIFINFFLEKIIEANIEGSKVKFIAPEFPLKKGENYQSTNVDYLCKILSSDGQSNILLVELKTDTDYFNDNQFYTYLEYRDCKNWGNLSEDLIKISLSDGMLYKKRKKYYNLVKVLANNHIDLIEYNCATEEIDKLIQLEEKDLNENKTTIRKTISGLIQEYFNNVEIKSPEMPIELVYIVPKGLRIEKLKLMKDTHVKCLFLNNLGKLKVVPKYQRDWDLFFKKILKNI